MKKKSLAIIGGGASGLAAAIEAADNNPNITITVFDRMAKAGKKILATGNGRCNFSNEDLSPRHFYGDGEFLRKVLTSSYSDDESFFREMGMLSYHEDGRIYPRSQQASAVRDTLIYKATESGVSLVTETAIDTVKRLEKGFEINGEIFDAVIICGGGCAAPAQGSDGSCYAIAKSLGHSITPLYPALCGLTTPSKDLSVLKGVRCEGKATLFCDNKYCGEEAGEIQFTDKGVSGIPIMNLSHLCGDSKDIKLSLDLCSDVNREDLSHHINEAKGQSPDKETEDVLAGIVNNKLGFAIMGRARIKAHTPIGKLKGSEINNLINILKAFDIAVTGTRGFENAQVSRGGICTSEIDPETMKSKISDGLYFAGEILDIHGDCGGYNLHLAFTTGRIAGISASEYLK